MSLAVAGLPANKMLDPVAPSNSDGFSLKGTTSSNSAPVSDGGALAQVNLCAGPDEPDPSTFAHLSYMTTFGSPDRQRDAAQALEALREQMTEDPRGKSFSHSSETSPKISASKTCPSSSAGRVTKASSPRG